MLSSNRRTFIKSSNKAFHRNCSKCLPVTRFPIRFWYFNFLMTTPVCVCVFVPRNFPVVFSLCLCVRSADLRPGFSLCLCVRLAEFAHRFLFVSVCSPRRCFCVCVFVRWNLHVGFSLCLCVCLTNLHTNFSLCLCVWPVEFTCFFLCLCVRPVD